MQGIAFVCVLCLSAHVAGAEKSEVTPVQKVIQLMEGMLEKGKKREA